MLALVLSPAAAQVGLVLQEDPPLPGEPLDGWEALEPAAPLPAGEVLEIDQAVARALAGHPALRRASAEVTRARGVALGRVALPNPTWEVGIGEATEVSVGLDLTDALLAPARAARSRRDVDAAELELLEASIVLAYEVRAAYAAHQAAIAAWGAALRGVDALAASRDQARALVDAGNVPIRALTLREASYEEGRQRAAALELEVVATRERLARAIGAEVGSISPLVVPTAAPVEPDLEARAVDASLALAALRARHEAARQRVASARLAGLVPDIDVGVGLERRAGEAWSANVAAEFGLPLFAFGRSAVLGARSEADSLAADLQLAELAVRSEARQLRDRLTSVELRARHLQEVLLPARQRVLEETLLQYNAMQLGLDPLLDAWRGRVDADIALAQAAGELAATRAAVEALLSGARVEVLQDAPRAGRSVDSEGGH